MSNEPLVSVVIIFLNAEQFFAEAIESVFAQAYDNWELLLVDDGSTDKSTEIALRYAEQYPQKVRYLEHEQHRNLGMSATRNLGVRNAKGEYIAFLDADDIWLPQKLEQQVAILKAQPEAGMVYGATQYWYGWTNKPEDIQRDLKAARRKLGVQADTLVKPPTLLTLFLQGEAETPGTCSVLIRRELVNQVGGFEESFRGLFEDQAFFAKLYLQTLIFVEGGCWDRYRQHPDSCCHVATSTGEYHYKKLNSAHLTFLLWLQAYLLQQDFKDAEVWQALQKKLWPYRHPRQYHLLKQTRLFLEQVRARISRIARKCTEVFYTLRQPGVVGRVVKRDGTGDA